MMRVLFASSNPHKVDEVRAILSPIGIEVEGLDSLSQSIPEPEETGLTFAENARIKAIAYARAAGRMCLADDSGLEVDALGGAPGVHSARYADAKVNAGSDERPASHHHETIADARKTRITRTQRDAANNAKLLREVRGIPMNKRTARFVCAMCLADADGNVLAETRGTFEGLIADQPAGSNGFGYDPLLFLPDRGCTSAQLAPAEKNARSHRGQAARAMALWLQRHNRTAPRTGAHREG